MLAIPWCDHTEGFESGLRVGEWEHASGMALADAIKFTVMVKMAPIFLRNSLQLGTNANSVALRTALLQWCYFSRNFGANPTVSAGNGTSADDDRMQVDSLEKGKGKGKSKHHNQKRKSHDQHDQHELYRHQHVQELWQNWTLAGGAYDNSTSNNSNTERQESQERQREKQTRGRCGNESAI